MITFSQVFEYTPRKLYYNAVKKVTSNRYLLIHIVELLNIWCCPYHGIKNSP